MKYLECEECLLEIARLCGLQGSRLQGTRTGNTPERDTFPFADGSAAPRSSDPYSQRMQAALAQINRLDYPAGMILWLNDAEPGLYRLLTVALPNKVHEVWSTHGSLEEFDWLMARLVRAHQRACELYRQHLQKGSEGILERPQGAEQPK